MIKIPISIKRSSIHGIGMHSVNILPKDKIVATVFLSENGRYIQTKYGAWVNHSNNPNCYLRADEKGDVEMVTKDVVKLGVELTANYRELLDISSEFKKLPIEFDLP
jgi:SET domain-containing protein